VNYRIAIASFVLALSITGSAWAQSTSDLQGTWVWEVEGRNLTVLKLGSGPQGLRGTMQRPAHITFTFGGNGLSVSGITMPVQTRAVHAVREATDGRVMRSTAADGSTEQFVLRLDGKGGLLLRVDPDPRAPTITFIRPRDPASVAADWDQDRTYVSRSPTEAEASSPELAAIFAADQADRQAGRNTDWKIVEPRDKARRARVRQMLDEGLLHSADDYHRAAFVFQHGDKPDDFLLAHVLAMAAQGKGHPGAGWIAMATLDRYLQNVGRAQVLGTQYVNVEGGGTTKGLYDDALIPDSLRLALGVPTRAQDEAQRAAMEAAKKE
jgi:hypothetical protein